MLVSIMKLVQRRPRGKDSALIPAFQGISNCVRSSSSSRSSSSRKSSSSSRSRSSSSFKNASNWWWLSLHFCVTLTFNSYQFCLSIPSYLSEVIWKRFPTAHDYVAGCIIGKTIRLKSQHCSAPPRTFSEIASCLLGCSSGFVSSTRSSIPYSAPLYRSEPCNSIQSF